MTEYKEDELIKILHNTLEICSHPKLEVRAKSQSSLSNFKLVCPECKREWTFCMLCDSPLLCFEKSLRNGINCVRGFK